MQKLPTGDVTCTPSIRYSFALQNGGEYAEIYGPHQRRHTVSHRLFIHERHGTLTLWLCEMICSVITHEEGFHINQIFSCTYVLWQLHTGGIQINSPLLSSASPPKVHRSVITSVPSLASPGTVNRAGHTRRQEPVSFSRAQKRGKVSSCAHFVLADLLSTLLLLRMRKLLNGD